MRCKYSAECHIPDSSLPQGRGIKETYEDLHFLGGCSPAPGQAYLVNFVNPNVIYITKLQIRFYGKQIVVNMLSGRCVLK